MQTRTRRQREVLDFITRYLETHGHEPSYQVIARHLGLSSRAGIAKHVKALEDQGLLERHRENGKFRLKVGRKGASQPANTAGIGWLEVATDGSESEDWEVEPFEVPAFMLGNYDPSQLSAVRVPDNALAGRGICEGDIVLFEKRRYARDGNRVVATVENKETIVRNFYRAGADVEFRCDCEDAKPLRYSADEVEIHGIFRGLLRPAG